MMQTFQTFIKRTMMQTHLKIAAVTNYDANLSERISSLVIETYDANLSNFYQKNYDANTP